MGLAASHRPPDLARNQAEKGKGASKDPLALTGVESAKCDVELFVFGSGRTEIDGFKVKHCGTPFSSDKRTFGPPQPGEYRIHAPEVLGFALPAAFATRLIGHLKARDMRNGAYIHWKPFEPTLQVLHSSRGAMSIF